MPNFRVKFHKVLQNSQELGSDDEHMVSQVFFTLEVDGESVGEHTATLKQTVGSDFDEANIEVGPPSNYEGTFDHEGFSTVARQYFNNNIGAYGRGMRIEGQPRNIAMAGGQPFRAAPEFT
jgi:hypothetical protein